MPTAYKWHPITDLPENWESLADGELGPLKRVWDGQRPELVERGALDQLDKEIRRGWAIETGIIEKAYTLDRGTTQTLIERGIDAALIPHEATDRPPEMTARIVQDHYDALEGLFDFIRGQRTLSASYVKELHAALLRNTDTYAVVDQFGKAFEKPLPKGAYKTEPNSPTVPDGTTHEYCPPEHVASEMDRLIGLHAEHEACGIPPEIEAAWLHHRFAQIHPFADGNGRVARTVASLVFIRAGWFPLIVKRDDWIRYINALERADQGDLLSLVRLFVSAQRSAFISLLQRADRYQPAGTETTPEANSADRAIAAARDVLRKRGVLELEDWGRARTSAGDLLKDAHERLNQISAQLAAEIRGRNFRFGASHVTAPADRTMQLALRDVGHEFASNAGYTRVDLNLDTGQPAGLVLVWLEVGQHFRGLVQIVAYLRTPKSEPVMLKDGTFQVNYEEDAQHTRRRFSRWIESVIVEGLNEWRKTL
jgi:Fic family protein